MSRAKSVDERAVKVYNFNMTKQEFEAILASAGLNRSDEDLFEAVSAAIDNIKSALGCKDEQ